MIDSSGDAMFDGILLALTFCSTLGCGLIAGVFFGFSTFVMKALGRIPPAQGITAMQSINVVVVNPWFLATFVGTAVGCLLLAFRSLSAWNEPGSKYLFAGSVFYLAGTLLVTIAFNVPRNNALAGVDPVSTDGARFWAGFLKSWTTWNHVRTVASLAAAASLAVAIRDL